MGVLDNIALVLVIVGAADWGCVGLFQWDFLAAIFGGVSAPGTRIVYIVIALAGLWTLRLLSLVCQVPRVKSDAASGESPRPRPV